MSRVINTNGTGKERNTFTRGIVAALRELMKQKEPDAHSYDLVAFIGLSLVAIDANVEQSVKAWEKRDYWVKADRFRMEWSWAGQLGKEILSSSGGWRLAKDCIMCRKDRPEIIFCKGNRAIQNRYTMDRCMG